MRLLVSGYYGAGNLGDEALLAGLLLGLARHSLLDVTVLSADAAATRRLHGVAAAHRFTGAPLALWRSTALLSGGGGLLQDRSSARSLRYYLGVLRLAKRLGRLCVVYAQSLGPLSGPGRRAVQATLVGLPLAVRDEPSLALARELGLSARHVGDPALLLEVPEAAAREALVLVPRGGFPRATELLGALGRSAQRSGRPVEAMAFHPRVDAPELARLHDLVPGLVVAEASAPGEAAAALAGAALVVSARLHGLVLAAAAGVPHAGISYDPKVEGFARETSAPCWAVPSSGREAAIALEALTAFALRPVLDAERVRGAVQRAADGVRWLAHEVLGVPSGSAAQAARERPPAA